MYLDPLNACTGCYVDCVNKMKPRVCSRSAYNLIFRSLGIIVFYFLGLQKSLQMVTAAMKLKDTPWKKSYDKPKQHIKKQRHYFTSKALSSESCGFFPWSRMDVRVGTQRKLSTTRIDAFEWWQWRRLLRVPWAARRSNQYNLKEISPEYSLKGLMLKLKLQYFGHLL